MEGGPESNDWCFKERELLAETQEDDHVTPEAATGAMRPQLRLPGITSKHPALEEEGRVPSLEPSEGARPCRHLDAGLVASRRERIHCR